MQPFSGATGRGRGRGRGANNFAGARGQGFAGAMSRGQSTPRGAFGQPTRGNASGATRGGLTNGFGKQPSRGGRGALASSAQTQGSWQQRFDKLEIHRKRERADAIANGIIADPDRPRALSQALTPTATCTDMCPEFERMQRGTQNDVWVEEKDLSQPGVSPKDAPPVEAKMVKKFRRAAAGIEEQLPSDLRTPQVLSQTCDYLFNDIVANAPELGRVHHFVWDRTRAIRNDFTILQVSSAEDLIYAVDCLERIARFHIVSLHQMAGVKEKDFQYDWQQDREQLDRTLVSLMQYYDDSRGKIPLPNEPEFRAYLIVFQLQDPDMEDRVQSWPHDLVQHARVRKAMKLYAAAGNTSSLQGPLRPPATLPIAQQDWQRFWKLTASKRTSYLTACVAEINFNLIRRVALQALTRSVNQRATADFTTEELCDILAFNDAFEAEDYLACYNITFVDREEGRFADISALKNRQVLPEPSSALPKQLKSDMVEEKRYGRTLPAVISGFSVKEAQSNGMLNEDEIGANDEEMGDEDAGPENVGNGPEDEEPVNDGESLFLPETAKGAARSSPFSLDFDAPQTSIFEKPAEQPKPSPFAFGKPSTGTFGNVSTGDQATPASANGSATQKPPSFNFLGGGTSSTSTGSTFNSTPAPTSNAFLGFGQQKSPAAASSPFGALSTGDSAKKDTATPTFGGFNFTSQTDAPAKQPSPVAPSSPFSKLEQKATSSLFSQPAKPSGPPKPFVEDGSDSSTNNSPQVSEFPSTAAPPKPSSTKPELPAFSFAAPNSKESEASKTQSSPFSLGTPFAKPEEGAKQTNAAPSFLPEPSTTTSPATSNAKPAPPPKPTSTPSFSFASDNNSSASARRGSVTDNFNKPAHPSPLAQSFTAASDASSEAPVEPASQPSSQPVFPPAPSFSKPKDAPPPPKPAERKPVAPEPDFASVIHSVARDLTLAPDVGLIDQYLEWRIGHIITNTQEKLHFERINAIADEHRAGVLRKRYGPLWRELCRKKRLARRGKEGRKRQQERLKNRNQASETGSVSEAGSVLDRSQFGRTMGARLSRQEEVDKMFQQSTSNGRWSRLAKQDEQTKGGSKRPTSSHSMEPPVGTRETGHKRLKSTSHVDNDGRISKPAPTSHPNNATLKRSSFRESLPDNPPLASTTKSNYFRLKALGLAHTYDLAPTHPRKRPHAELSRSPAPESRQSSVAHSPPQRNSPPSSKLRRSSSASVRSRNTTEETDSILARAKAARELLRDGGSPMQMENDGPDAFRQSAAETFRQSTADVLRQSTGSQVLYDSPSLERARVDARLRASLSGTDFGSSRRSDVPAYRLRESKFVPREQYGKAIERSKEMRQSRSGESSRPVSRIDMHTPSKLAEVEAMDSRPAPPSFLDSSFDTIGTQATGATFGGLPQANWPNTAPSHFSPGITPFDDATQNISPAQPNVSGGFGFGAPQSQLSNFENHTFQSPQIPGFANHTFQTSQSPTLQNMENFFGQPNAGRTSVSYQTGFARDAPAEQSNEIPSNVGLETQDDSDNELEITSVNGLTVNGTGTRHTSNGHQSEQLSEEEEEQVLGHANPYAALGNGFGDEEEDDEEEDEEGEDEEIDDGNEQLGQYDYPADQPGVYPGAYHSGEFEDDDGDIEDEDGVGFEEDEDESDLEDEDEDEEDEEEDDGQYLDPSMLPQNQSAAKPAAVEEVIELSD